MIVFPNCKINLGLRVLEKRADGYHNIETIFYPVPLKDALEIIHADNTGFGSIQFTSSGFKISGQDSDNLCVKAYGLLKKDFPQLPSIKMHLHKAVPMGAGLGGGSADAAFTLQLLNDQFKLNISTGQLINYALMLGSDCPFFIVNKACSATGRGEILHPISLDLSAYELIIVNPGIHVNTGEAFSGMRRQSSTDQNMPLREIVAQPINTWQHYLINDFEQPIFEKYTVIGEIKKSFYQAGASYAAMSGSGSTVYGLFDKQLHPEINFDPAFFVSRLSL